MKYQRHGRGPASSRWKGCGAISQTYFCNLRKDAKRRGIPCELTIEDLRDVFEQQEGKCALSGLLLTTLGLRCKGVSYSKGTASVDRKDSSRGYSRDNIQWVHKDINFMKRTMSDAKFVEMCRLVANHNAEKKE